MAKIVIKDLPKDYKISEEEMKLIKGGLFIAEQIEIADSISGSSTYSGWDLKKNTKF